MSGVFRFAAALVICICVARAAAGVELDQLKNHEQAQKRATDVARGLVANMLDLQLRQLRENGLENSQLGRDVRLMRDEIDTLVKQEMQDVIALLVKAQEVTPKEREAIVNEVRGKTRDIVITLAAERQKLLRRLRMSRLESQVKELIARQSAIRDVTAGLLKQTEGAREKLVLAARQDQRDVRTLFATLEHALQDVASWGGEIGAEAIGGIQD
jgi:alanyl-tRNA synthetase